ncbi:hypothetical protein FXO38_30360 [Capsicum annuum]|nr:hypothetical protein FXO38_30360 [Capsicum annuum]KAF3664548.1 hypothetical protein FXO37_11431 [Capsicum annuum]
MNSRNNKAKEIRKLKRKYLVLKASKSDSSKGDTNVAYLAKKIVRGMKKTVKGDTSSESDETKNPKDVSMLALEDSEITYDSLFALMEKLEDKDENEVTLSDIKEKLDNYFAKNIKNLANVLIDSSDGKGKKEAFGVQIELEEELKDSENNLIDILHKNEELERDLVRIREDLNKSLKWTTSSQILSNLTSQRINNGRGLGYQNRTYTFGSQGKYVPIIKNKELKLKWVPKSNRLQVWGMEGSQNWFMDSGFSNHITGRTDYFLSLKMLQGGVSHLEMVKFLSDGCTMSSLKYGKVILRANRCKNMYAADLNSVADYELTYLSVQVTIMMVEIDGGGGCDVTLLDVRSLSPNSITETVGCIHLTDMPHTILTGVQPITPAGRVSIPRYCCDGGGGWWWLAMVTVTEVVSGGFLYKLAMIRRYVSLIKYVLIGLTQYHTFAVKRSNISSSDEWVAENLILLTKDPRESSFGLEKQIVGENIGDDTEVGEFVLSPNKENDVNDEELPIRWLVQKHRGSKRKLMKNNDEHSAHKDEDNVELEVNGFEEPMQKKMRQLKSSVWTYMRKIVRRKDGVERAVCRGCKEPYKVGSTPGPNSALELAFSIGGHVVTKYRSHEDELLKETMSNVDSNVIEVKKKIVSERSSPKKRKAIEDKPTSSSKRRRKDEEEKFVSKEKRNKVLKNQKVLTGRVFNSKIFEKLRMVELIEYVRQQCWLHLLEEPVPSVYEAKVRKFFYNVKFSKNEKSLIALVQGKKIKLDEETLGKILDVPIMGVRNVSKQHPSTEFMVDVSKV